MSLMKTLARVAAGVVLAKGIGAAMQHRQQQTHPRGGPSGDGLLAGIFGSNTSRNRSETGRVLGGNRGGGTPYGGAQSTGAQGGLGGILDRLTRGAGGQGGVLGQLSGGRQGGGGLGDLLGGLLGGAAGGAAAGGLAHRGSQPANDASFGELFNDALSNDAEPAIAPTPEQNAVAGLMLKAMIQAAKSDGRIDDDEKQRLLGEVGDLDDEERQFIREQMAAPIDAAALAREVPKGLESQVYLMSLMAINFDNEAEARYLDALARALGIGREAVNQIHDDLGAMRLYS